MAGASVWQPVVAAANWLRSKTAEDFAIIEAEGRPTFLTDVRRRNPQSGELESQPVRLRSPNHLDKAKARIDALEWVKEITHRNARPSWAEAIAELGEPYVDQLDTVCLLARCTRDYDAPEHQHLEYHELDARYGRPSLDDLWERLNQLDVLQDPRADELDERQFWTLVTAIDRMRNVGPLAAISGPARDSFVLSMASQLASSRKSSSSSPSTET